MRLLILGAGFMQINAIRKAQKKGHTVIVSDYLPDAPGKKIADFSEMTSSFDVTGNIAIARKYRVDGIFTIGTDQPVLTAARVAEELGLPQTIDSSTARMATNKKYMKEAFDRFQIPSSRYCLIHREQIENRKMLQGQLQNLQFPIVVKPIDSQGQRGVFKLDKTETNIVDYMKQTFAFTASDEIIVEEYFDGDEITISAWVEDYRPYILLITDRPLWNIEPHLGVPDGHIFPSKYLNQHFEKIMRILKQVAEAMNIPSGPVYAQMMVRDEEVMVIEVACRIGGGHEEELIPLLTGIDVVDMLIEKSLGNPINVQQLQQYRIRNNDAWAMVKFIRAHPGTVKEMGDLQQVKLMPGVVNAGFYNRDLKQVRELTDSTCRIGYLMIKGKNREDMRQKAAEAYQRVQVLNHAGENMVY